MTVKVNDSKRFHFLMHEIDARINNETMKQWTDMESKCRAWSLWKN